MQRLSTGSSSKQPKSSNTGPREHKLQAALLQTRVLEADFIKDMNPKGCFKEKGLQ